MCFLPFIIQIFRTHYAQSIDILSFTKFYSFGTVLKLGELHSTDGFLAMFPLDQNRDLHYTDKLVQRSTLKLKIVPNLD